MKFVSWNVNGIRACVQKGFLDFFTEAVADIFCIQESKMQEGQLELDLPGYHQYWNYAVKKGYSGTAVFTKSKKCRMADRLFLCFGKFERASERCEDFDRCDGIGSLSY